MLKILPQSFYEDPNIQTLLADGISCIVHKQVQEAVWHKEGFVSTHAITMVLKGLLRIENDEGLFTEIPAGKAVLLPKGLYTVSDIIPPRGGHFEAMVFFFEREVIARFLESLNCACSKEKSITHLVLDSSDGMRLFADSMLQLYGKNRPANRQLTTMKLFEFLHLVHASPNGGNCLTAALATLNNKERKSLREFMEANYAKGLTIEDYADLTGRSISTFRRDFKSQFGVSPKQWLIERRLEKAHELLSKNHTSVTDVVMEVGYENIPHFTKAFREKFGLPPKQLLIQSRREAFV
ncbi:MAG: AraC family transcriptional regulator [Saprospiraceae bacterium]|nr:AraC family transcriptional regulator [Saprospiraceae bacterium]MCF8252752.1 AraC family transcriptional regulator [Saprospiraceae bacterium]MCF8283124.1 AraC family transcriptional regulator [Bacteroidales bacterium]MCF8314312.1 AraC family transcriptional regulator [Saprospiraceae bacterium]MCF8443179.1 AraC family transcriptional regulator [Saprospiraceae bacterium]